MYDQLDSEYYMINDFYHMNSDIYRSIFPNFSPYQQTMKDTSGIASVLMVLNYLGVDTKEYNEYQLMLLYEKLNGTKIYGNGTTSKGLKKLIDSLDLGYKVDDSDYVNPGSTRAVNEPGFVNWMKSQVDDGKFVIMRYTSKDGFGWQVVIGYDTRTTNRMLEQAITAGLIEHGVDVVKIGMVPTPLVGYATLKLDADAGIMLTASHNPFYDNGKNQTN